MSYLAEVREIIKVRPLDDVEKKRLESYLDSQIVNTDQKEEAANHDS